MYLLPDVKGSREYDKSSKRVPKHGLSAKVRPPDNTLGRSKPPQHCKIMPQMVVHCIWLAQYRY